MRNILLAVVGLLLVALLIFLGWRYLTQNRTPVAVDDSDTTAYETAFLVRLACQRQRSRWRSANFQTRSPAEKSGTRTCCIKPQSS